MTDDPEKSRAIALCRRVAGGDATEADREELELLLEDRPDLQPLVHEESRRRALGGAWLERVEADQRLKAAERTPLALVERGGGLALVAAGLLLSPLAPALATAALGSGCALLVWSFVRVKLKTFKQDPYRNIDR